MKIYSTISAVGLAHKLKFFHPVSISLFDSSEVKISISNKDFDEKEKCIIIASINEPNDFIEILLLLDALRNYKSITLILTFLFYSRQDKKENGESTGAAIIQKTLEFENVTHIYHLDIHSNFFNKPNTALYADRLFVNDIKYNSTLINPIVIAPDKKAESLARKVANGLETEIVVCEKVRHCKRISVYGDFSKVVGRDCVIVDDIVDTASTIMYTSKELNDNQANRVVAYCTHGVLSRNVLENLKQSCIEEIVVTDSICRLVPNPSVVRVISLNSILKEIVDGML